MQSRGGRCEDRKHKSSHVGIPYITQRGQIMPPPHFWPSDIPTGVVRSMYVYNTTLLFPCTRGEKKLIPLMRQIWWFRTSPPASKFGLLLNSLSLSTHSFLGVLTFHIETWLNMSQLLSFKVRCMETSNLNCCKQWIVTPEPELTSRRVCRASNSNSTCSFRFMMS